MIGDRVIPGPHHTRAAEQIVKLLEAPSHGERPVLTIAGESGSGKSEIASELARLLSDRDYSVFIFAQDDYFLYPPRTNDGMRRKNIDHVGTTEVNLALLDSHLEHFKNSDEPLEKPLVVFDDDLITRETIQPAQYNIGIAEGTYTSTLEKATTRVFIDRSFQDTHEDRLARKRDKIDAFSEQVLEIEHKIISEHRVLADIIVNKDFSITQTDLGKDRT